MSFEIYMKTGTLGEKEETDARRYQQSKKKASQWPTISSPTFMHKDYEPTTKKD